MDEDGYKYAAKEIATLWIKKLSVHLPDGFQGELSLLKLATLGLTVVTCASDSLTPDRLSFTVDPKLMSALLQTRSNTTALDYYYNLFVTSQTDPQKVIERSHDLHRQMEAPGEVRGLIREAAKTLTPPRKTGRPPKLDRSDWPTLLKTSEQLKPLCTALLDLQHYAKNRDLEDTLHYLKPDYPDAVAFLYRHLNPAKKLFTDRSLIAEWKSSETRSARLADIFAGLQFNLTPRYAILQIARARKLRDPKKLNNHKTR